MPKMHKLSISIPTALTALISALCLPMSINGQTTPRESRVVIPSGEWELIGDLVLPTSAGPAPGVLMLNEAAGNRQPYRELVAELANRGIAALRLDLRGHGESTNRGSFVPGAEPRSSMIWDAEADVQAAIHYMQQHPLIDGDRLGVVGASYSGEEMAESGRENGYAQAYVAMSPGSFSTASIAAIDGSDVPWLYIVARDDPFLGQVTSAVQGGSERAYVEILPGTEHATALLGVHPDLAERIAVWLATRLHAETGR